MSSSARRGPRFCSLLLLSTLFAACTGSDSTAPPQIQLNAQTNTVDVTGLPAATVAALSGSSWSDADWQALLRVSVKIGGGKDSTPAVAGKYAVVDRALRFTPMFPFDEGRQYRRRP